MCDSCDLLRLSCLVKSTIMVKSQDYLHNAHHKVDSLRDRKKIYALYIESSGIASEAAQNM